jgi:hypothetical protein
MPSSFKALAVSGIFKNFKKLLKKNKKIKKNKK